MYTISGWQKLESGAVKVEIVLSTLRRVKVVIHPKEANDESVRIIVENLMNNVKFNGGLK